MVSGILSRELHSMQDNNQLNRYIVRMFTTTVNYALFAGVVLGLVYLTGTLPFEDALKEKVVVGVLSAGGPIITMMQYKRGRP